MQEGLAAKAHYIVSERFLPQTRINENLLSYHMLPGHVAITCTLEADLVKAQRSYLAVIDAQAGQHHPRIRC